MNEEIINWGGNGPILHIAHANSYHPAVYTHLIDKLKQHFEVHSILFRPFLNKDVDEFKHWNQLRDDFLELADKRNWKDIIGVGHSLGSTITAMAAIKKPELFKKLVIIEPPCVDPIFFTILNITPYFIAKKIVPPSKAALKRRHKWPSKADAFLHFRSKSIYNLIDDETLNAFIESGLQEDENGEFRLTFSKFWESKIYCTIQNPYKLFPKLTIPSLCIRAAESDVILERNWAKWQSVHQNAKFINVKGGGHLIPMEQPDEIAKYIIDYSK